MTRVACVRIPRFALAAAWHVEPGAPPAWDERPCALTAPAAPDRIHLASAALLERGVLTVRQGDAAKPGEIARPQAGGPAPSGPAGPRNAQAEKYLQKGKADLEAGNKAAALTNFKRAIMLAPGDPVIVGYIDELDTKKK